MEEVTELIPEYSSVEITQESLLEYWNKFAQSIEIEMPRLYQVITSHLPQKITDNTILLQLENSSQQKDFMEKIQSNLLNFLKTGLNLPGLELKIEISEDAANKQIIYTASDKYNYLAEQNELLHNLKKSFNLDFE